MKKLWALLAIVLTFTLTMEAAHAKRIGGGKSFGRSYQTAPSQPSRSVDAPAQQRQQAINPQQAGNKKGIMGGLLGGLLMGGLLAALFAGGAFEGLQFMDILIIGLLAFVIFKLLKGLRGGATRPQPAYAPAGQPEMPQQKQQAPVFGTRREAMSEFPATASSATGEVIPFKLPLGFDSPAFLEGAKSSYRILQDAWNDNDLARIREFVTPELFEELKAERVSLVAAPQTEILILNAELVRADQQFGNAEVSVRFTGRYRDKGESIVEDFVDIWHLERDFTNDKAAWHITGMQSE